MCAIRLWLRLLSLRLIGRLDAEETVKKLESELDTARRENEGLVPFPYLKLY